jgi:hypothetical protein
MADSWPEIWRQYFWSHDGNKKFLFQAKNIANVERPRPVKAHKATTSSTSHSHLVDTGQRRSIQKKQ